MTMVSFGRDTILVERMIVVVVVAVAAFVVVVGDY